MDQPTSLGVTNMSSESALPWVLIPGFMLDETLWDEVIEHLPSTQDIHLAHLLEGQTIAQIAQHIAQSGETFEGPQIHHLIQQQCTCRATPSAGVVEETQEHDERLARACRRPL